MRIYINEPTETSRPFASLRATARARLAVDYMNEPTKCLILKDFHFSRARNEPTEDAPTKSNEPSKSAKTKPLGGIADKCPERFAKDLGMAGRPMSNPQKQTHSGAIVPIETVRLAQGDRSHTARGRLRNEAKSSRRIKHFRNERGWKPVSAGLAGYPMTAPRGKHRNRRNEPTANQLYLRYRRAVDIV